MKTIPLVGLSIVLIVSSFNSVLHAAPLAHDSGIATGSVAANQWVYYEVTVHGAASDWWPTLKASVPADPKLYVRRSTDNPTTSSYTKSSSRQTTDALTFSPSHAAHCAMTNDLHNDACSEIPGSVIDRATLALPAYDYLLIAMEHGSPVSGATVGVVRLLVKW